MSFAPIKIVKSPSYNYYFDRTTGFFARWGAEKEDDPIMSPYGVELLDIEVSTKCSGVGKVCSFCYKSNTPIGENMSFATFKSILDKMPRNLTQVAFGIGDIDGNPDLWKMFEYCRCNKINPGVIPNVTINGYGLNENHVKLLSSLCGAVAVSRYNPPDYCYNAVKRLTDAGMKQINIHMLVSKETLADCYQVMKDSKSDSRLDKLNAIVFLSLKPKGKRNKNTSVSQEEFKGLIDYAFEHNIPIGFDSCSAYKFMKAIEGRENYKKLMMNVEPCESTKFSFYIAANGRGYPCSFMEDSDPIIPEGIDMTKISDFMEDVWHHPKIEEWRSNLIKCTNRGCPVFEV